MFHNIGGLSEYGVYDPFADHLYGISIFVNLLTSNCNKKRKKEKIYQQIYFC